MCILLFKIYCPSKASLLTCPTGLQFNTPDLHYVLPNTLLSPLSPLCTRLTPKTKEVIISHTSITPV